MSRAGRPPCATVAFVTPHLLVYTTQYIHHPSIRPSTLLISSHLTSKARSARLSVLPPPPAGLEAGANDQTEPDERTKAPHGETWPWPNGNWTATPPGTNPPERIQHVQDLTFPDKPGKPELPVQIRKLGCFCRPEGELACHLLFCMQNSRETMTPPGWLSLFSQRPSTHARTHARTTTRAANDSKPHQPSLGRG